MLYTRQLLDARLIRRYKRFLADVELNGSVETVHCPNSGSMAGLTEPGNPVRISGPHGGTRKLPYTLEQVQITRPDGRQVWVGVNTSLPNRIVQEAAQSGKLPGYASCGLVRSEQKLGPNSRIDLVLEQTGLPHCWLEVKNCTMVQKDIYDKASVNVGNISTFPDAVTERGLKHLNLLIEQVRHGLRAAIVFTVQRDDAEQFAPAWAYHPQYAERFYKAIEAGVVMLPMPVKVMENRLVLGQDPLPIVGK